MAASGAVICVAPGMYQRFNDAAADLTMGFQALGFTTGAPQANQQAIAAVRGR